MKNKYLLATLIASSLCFNNISIAQEIHPALKTVASNILTNAEHINIINLDGDIGAIKQYLDIILKTAKDNGESIPEDFDMQEFFKIVGIDTIKAVGKSAKEIDNAWINHSYLEYSGNKSSLFSFLGEVNQPHVAANIFPAEVDLALQLQLDLKELAPMVIKIAELAGNNSAKNDLERIIPELNISSTELLSKLDFTVNLAIDVNTDEEARSNPLNIISNANSIVRIDGLTWLWDVAEDQLLHQSKTPLKRSEDKATGIVTYSAPDDMQAQLMGYKPQLIIDKANDHIWITTNESFYKKCKFSENKLANSPAFKAAMETLPQNANSMMYVSKELLLTANEQYEFAANNNMFGDDFSKGKKIVDRILEDLVESDKGWAIVLNKDENGIMLASRGPVGVHHLSYLQAAAPLIFYGRMSKSTVDRLTE